MVMVGCFGITDTIYAKEAEKVLADDVNSYGVQPRMACLECSSIMQMLEVCLPDSRIYSGTREHSYGLL